MAKAKAVNGKVGKVNTTQALAVTRKEGNTLANKISKIEVNDPIAHTTASQMLIDMVTVRKRAEKLFDPQIDASYKAWQIALQQKKQFLAPLVEAEKTLKEKLTKYELRVEEEIARLNKEAEEKAKAQEEKLKAKLQKKIDKTSDEEKKALLQEQMESTAVVANTVSGPAKVSGTASQKDWNIEIVDVKALLEAVFSKAIIVNVDALITVHTTPLKQYLKLSGKETIPGCKVERTKIQKVNVKG